MQHDPLTGVIPACLMPFDADLEIDEANLRRHVAALAAVDGVDAITVNAHASEVATLTAAEQRRVLEIVRDEVGGTASIIAGVYADSTADAARMARDAERDGADALLIFPSDLLHGSQLRPDMALAHYSAIAEATALPMIAFVYPAQSGKQLGLDALLAICTEVDNVAAVKEWSNDIVVYERNLRELKSLDKPISVLSSFSRSLLASLCVGADGILSGHGSVVATLHVEIFRAVEAGDLTQARIVWNRMYDFVEACYADPFLDGHNRMKEALAALGRIDLARVRPPLLAVPEDVRRRVGATAAALFPEG
ncbi:MAG: dihydrodipicolinate synthase [Aeromicrobium sp.]|jgi:4-hydroxy-tetrahydrodipicolinate synthase|nr:dihydrodipicolinate synthase [Aeromicrobium sp.]